MEQITIEIDKQAATKISVKGVKGGGCAALTKDIEEALGAVTAKAKTGEYCELPQAQKAVQR